MSDGDDDWDIGDLVPFSQLDGGRPGVLSSVALGFGMTVANMVEGEAHTKCMETVGRFEDGKISDAEMIKLLVRDAGEDTVKDALRRTCSLVFHGSRLQKDKIADREPLKKQQARVREMVEQLREQVKG